MLTKELSTPERVHHPSFIGPMYAEAVREPPDGGVWNLRGKARGLSVARSQAQSWGCALVAPPPLPRRNDTGIGFERFDEKL